MAEPSGMGTGSGTGGIISAGLTGGVKGSEAQPTTASPQINALPAAPVVSLAGNPYESWLQNNSMRFANVYY
jgi:hypothetical protein